MGKKAKPRMRRVKGTGSIFPDRRRGGWRAKLPAGRTPAGTLRYKHFSGPTPESVAEQMRDYAPPAKSVGLAEWSARWLKSLDVRDQSRENYRTNLDKRILPSLGALPVRDITPFHVQEAARLWSSRVGAATVALTISTLSACLQAACLADLTARNAACLVKRPRPERP